MLQRMTLDDCFRQATATDRAPAGNPPYEYPCRLACGRGSEPTNRSRYHRLCPANLRAV